MSAVWTIDIRGLPLNGGTHQQYIAELDGEQVYRGRLPFFGSARALLDRGADPSDTLAMRWRGRPMVAMTGSIGEAAKLTITADGERMRWSPFTMKDAAS